MTALRSFCNLFMGASLCTGRDMRIFTLLFVLETICNVGFCCYSCRCTAKITPNHINVTPNNYFYRMLVVNLWVFVGLKGKIQQIFIKVNSNSLLWAVYRQKCAVSRSILGPCSPVAIQINPYCLLQAMKHNFRSQTSVLCLFNTIELLEIKLYDLHCNFIYFSMGAVSGFFHRLCSFVRILCSWTRILISFREICTALLKMKCFRWCWAHSVFIKRQSK